MIDASGALKVIESNDCKLHWDDYCGAIKWMTTSAFDVAEDIVRLGGPDFSGDIAKFNELVNDGTAWKLFSDQRADQLSLPRKRLDLVPVGNIGDRLRKYARKTGKSITRIAGESGVSRRTLVDYLRVKAPLKMTGAGSLSRIEEYLRLKP
jgi:hypothetical protein